MPSNDFQKQLSKLRRDKKILWLGVLFFVLVVLWILVGIFATTKTSSITPAQRELAKSFVPRLESKVFEEILQKQMYDEGDLGLFPIYVIQKNEVDGSTGKVDIMQQFVLVIEEVAVSSASATTSASINDETDESTISGSVVEETTDSAIQSTDDGLQ